MECALCRGNTSSSRLAL
uniref:Uncharacterized protein n=1 Tax=Arundo donax TaxID=35708 RepID=A0A0A9BWK1_ARUDO